METTNNSLIINQIYNSSSYPVTNYLQDLDRFGTDVHGTDLEQMVAMESNSAFQTDKENEVKIFFILEFFVSYDKLFIIIIIINYQ